jgi:4-amino-4-deoxy-L-arabinose transferase-like glycosyltransferase
LIPIAFCLLLIPRNKESGAGIWRFIVLGILFGLGFLVKPHLAISAPVIFFAILFSRFGLSGFSAHDFLKCFVVTAVSFAVPLLVSLFLIYKNGALHSFYEIFFRYLPLYNDIDSNYQVIADPDRILYTIKSSLFFGGMRIFFISALVSLAVFGVFERQTAKKSSVQPSFNVLLACLVLYGFYPAIAGKFWDYHYLPFMYFCSLALSVVFCGSAGNVRFFGFVFSRGICAVLVVFSFIYLKVFIRI